MRPGANAHARVRRVTQSSLATGLGILVYIPPSQLPWISLLHSSETRTRAPRFLRRGTEASGNGGARMGEEAASSSSFEYIGALR